MADVKEEWSGKNKLRSRVFKLHPSSSSFFLTVIDGAILDHASLPARTSTPGTWKVTYIRYVVSDKVACCPST